MWPPQVHNLGSGRGYNLLILSVITDVIYRNLQLRGKSKDQPNFKVIKWGPRN